LVEILTEGNENDTQYYQLDVSLEWVLNNFMVKRQSSIYVKNIFVLWTIFISIFYLYCAI
jgi:hypothetical protein